MSFGVLLSWFNTAIFEGWRSFTRLGDHVVSILATRGAGCIGSDFVLEWRTRSEGLLVSRENRGRAGRLEFLKGLQGREHHDFLLGVSPSPSRDCPTFAMRLRIDILCERLPR
ncbi:hypothetical protein C0V76_06475 [Uliginosibacterium sp. TH139]|nr:hypothetical protein C0V76_06475 [Uliginosibacterium sp. TH139]